MKTYTILVAALLLTGMNLHGQESSQQISAEQSTHTINRIYDKGSPDFYSALQRSWIANQNISYVSLGPYVNSVGSRRVPLVEGEGQSTPFQLLEANLDFRFTLGMGRKSSNTFWRRGRVTFDYATNFRMTLDYSKPLTPWSNRVGFGLDYSIWDDETGWFWKDKGRKEDRQISNMHTVGNEYTTDYSGKKDQGYFDFINLLIQVHHYSNGQNGNFTYLDSSSGLTRNNYLSGDFSTNYLKSQLTWGRINKTTHSLNQFTLGYRFDLGDDESAFAYSAEQVGNYGYHRVSFIWDWRSRPYLIGKGCVWKQYNESYTVKKAYQLHWRNRIEFIGGDMSTFQANLLDENGNPSSGLYRFNFSSQFELSPLNHRSIGYMIMFYTGRDYLNIRYDDIIYSVQVGLTMALDKYYPSTWSSNNTIIR